MAALLLACGHFSYAQNGIRASSQVTSSIITPGPLSTVTGSVIAICNFPANATPCTNKATTYTDNTLGTPCSTSTQVVLDGTTSCVAATDNRGNWGVWVAAGTYAYTITVSTGQSFGPFWFSAGGTGAGGSGTVGPCGTANALAKFGTTTSVVCSSVTDDGTNPTRAPNGLNSASGPLSDEWQVDIGGVLANHLACRSPSSAIKVVICPAGATLTVIGVAQSTVAAGGNVVIEYAAKANVCTTNNTTLNDWLIPSLTTPGCVDDTGSAIPPTAKTFAWPAENTVSGGANVQITQASLDTLIAASTGGNVPSCSQFSQIYQGAVGIAAVYACLNPPTGPSGAYFLCGYLPTGVAVAPSCIQTGIGIRTVSGTTDTIVCADTLPKTVRYTNGGAISVTVPDIGSTCFSSNPAFKAVVDGTGTVTFNRTTNSKFFVDNGTISSLVSNFSAPPGSFVTFQNADGTNWLATITQIISAAGGTTPVPNVQVITSNAYTVLNSDNLWDDKIAVNSLATVTLPQASSVTSAPLVASRVSRITGCSTCTTSSFAQTAGNRLLISVYWTGNGGVGTTLNSFSDSSGDSCSRIQPDVLIGGGTSVGFIQCTNIATAAANTIQFVFSGTGTVDSGIAEYTTTVTDQSGETSTTSPTATINLSIPVSNASELAVISGAGFAESCPAGWTVRGTPGDGSVFCDRLISNQASVSGQLTSTGNNGGAVIIMADFGISGVTSFTTGWEFYVSNASPNCSDVKVVPQGTSKINTALLSNLTEFHIPCGMTARFRSDGANYEMFQLTGTNGQPLFSTYTNATTSFTSTVLTFPLQAGEQKSGSCRLTYQGTATTAAPILQFTGPAAPSVVTANLTETLTSGSSPTFYSASTTGNTFAIGLGATAIVSTATDMPMTLDFGITNGSTAGVVTLQAKSNGAGTITFEKGSTCVVY